jgi:hypothetical protein
MIEELSPAKSCRAVLSLKIQFVVKTTSCIDDEKIA